MSLLESLRARVGVAHQSAGGFGLGILGGTVTGGSGLGAGLILGAPGPLISGFRASPLGSILSAPAAPTDSQVETSATGRWYAQRPTSRLPSNLADAGTPGWVPVSFRDATHTSAVVKWGERPPLDRGFRIAKPITPGPSRGEGKIPGTRSAAGTFEAASVRADKVSRQLGVRIA